MKRLAYIRKLKEVLRDLLDALIYQAGPKRYNRALRRAKKLAHGTDS